MSAPCLRWVTAGQRDGKLRSCSSTGTLLGSISLSTEYKRHGIQSRLHSPAPFVVNNVRPCSFADYERVVTSTIRLATPPPRTNTEFRSYLRLGGDVTFFTSPARLATPSPGQTPNFEVISGLGVTSHSSPDPCGLQHHPTGQTRQNEPRSSIITLAKLGDYRYCMIPVPVMKIDGINIDMEKW